MAPFEGLNSDLCKVQPVRCSQSVDYLSFCLDGGSMVQQNLYNPDVTVSGCAVQRRQLILEEKDYQGIS